MSSTPSSSVVSAAPATNTGSAGHDEPDAYPYVLRSALWTDRHADGGDGHAPLHGGGAMTSYVRRLFGVPNDKQLDPVYRAIKVKTDDKHLYRDLQRYLAQLQAGIVNGRTQHDFDSQDHYAQWKALEEYDISAELDHLARDPRNARKSKYSTPALDDALLFVPPGRAADDHYLALLRRAQQDAHDANPDMPAIPLFDAAGDAMVALVQRRWRINRAFHAVAILDRLMTATLLRVPPPRVGANAGGSAGTIARGITNPTQSTLAALDTVLAPHLAAMAAPVKGVMQHLAALTSAQTAYVRRVLTYLVDTATHRLLHHPDYYPRTQLAAAIDVTARVLSMVAEIAAPLGPGNSPQLANPLGQLPAHLKLVAYKQFTRLVNTIEAPGGDSDALARVGDLASAILGELDALRDFSDRPAYRSASRHVARYLIDYLFTHVDQHWLDARNQQIAKVFHVYNRMLQLMRRSDECGDPIAEAAGTAAPTNEDGSPAPTAAAQRQAHLAKRYQVWFQDAVDDWIERTSETMTDVWTHRMVAEDTFTAQGDGHAHSTSVVDLFSAFHQEIDAIQSLAWPSFDHEYCALKRFAKMICATLLRYSDALQGQLIALLLQLEEEAQAATEAQAAAVAAESGDRSPRGVSGPERSKSLMQRLRHHLGGRGTSEHKDKSIASKVVRRVRVPVSFSEPMCVRLNNIYSAKKRVDDLYLHLVMALSKDPPADDYVSPFYLRDETLLACHVVEVLVDAPDRTVYSALLDAPGPDGGMLATADAATPAGQEDVFYVDVAVAGTRAGQSPAIQATRVVAGEKPPPMREPPSLDLDDAITVPATTAISVQLTLMAAVLDGIPVGAPAPPPDPSQSAAAQLPEAKDAATAVAAAGIVCGNVAVQFDARDVMRGPLEKVYTVDVGRGSAQVHPALVARGLAGRKVRVRVRWARAESRYLHYWFQDAYAKLAVMADNVLLMMANQIGVWLQEYMLQLVKQYKVQSLAAAFGGVPQATSDWEVGTDGGALTFKTRAGKKQISFETIENDMQPLLDYLNKTLEVLNNTLDDELTSRLFRRVWRQVLRAIEWQLVGRRDKRTGKWKQLDGAQLTVLRRALTLLYDFFYVEGEGLPRRVLQSRHYHRLTALLAQYHESSDDLIRMYLSALNFYLAARIERIHKRARSAALARAASLATLSISFTPGQGTTPTDSPFASLADLANVPSAGVAVPGAAFLPPTPAAARRHTLALRTRARTAESTARGQVAQLSASDFLAVSGHGTLMRRSGARPTVAGADAKAARFKYVRGRHAPDAPASDSDSESESDEAGAADDEHEADGVTLVDAAARDEARAQIEYKLASLAKQEAVWALLCLRAESEHEVRDFVQSQQETVRVILENLQRETAAAGGHAAVGARGGGAGGRVAQVANGDSRPRRGSALRSAITA
ncbi:hypothetical protein GGF32_001924 [Allomyces javanicus]|nr:hypothetical protein GGF32_001924 [Allomyces javanicus]